MLNFATLQQEFLALGWDHLRPCTSAWQDGCEIIAIRDYGHDRPVGIDVLQWLVRFTLMIFS